MGSAGADSDPVPDDPKPALYARWRPRRVIIGHRNRLVRVVATEARDIRHTKQLVERWRKMGKFDDAMVRATEVDLAPSRSPRGR